MESYVRFAKEVYYHLVEVKLKTNSFSYKWWAIRRFLKIILRKSNQLEGFLPDFDSYISNKYGTFFIPKRTDFVFTVSSIVEANLLPYFTLPDEGIFLDIGANAGKYTVIMAKRHPKAMIFSFEPSPYTISVLEKNVNANGIGNRVKLLNIGLSDDVDVVLFAYSSSYTGVSHVVDTSTGQYNRFAYDHKSVNVKPLDLVVEEERINIKNIHLVKIDVEGHEIKVLKGAINTLSKMPKESKVIIEIHPDATKLEFIKKLFRDFGFSHEQIDIENHVFVKN